MSKPKTSALPPLTAGRVLRPVVRQTLIALPFAFFFGFLFGGEARHYLAALKASLIYAYVIGAAIVLNSRLVAPRLVPQGVPLAGRPLVIEAASYALAGLLGSMVAAILIHLTIFPEYLATGRNVVAVLLYSLLFCVLFMALAYAQDYYRGYLERVRAEEQMKAQLAQAELRALRAQVNPHFLFNALNSIAALIAVDPARAEAMTERLAEVFRYTLRGSGRELAPLGEELEFVRAYLEIERARMGERLRVVEEVAPEALDCQVPALVLQPLVENAVLHAAGARTEGGTVRLAASVRDGALTLEVADDGPGFDPAAEGDGFGLRSVRERVRGLGPGHTFEVESSPGRGTRVRVSLPVVEAGQRQGEEDRR